MTAYPQYIPQTGRVTAEKWRRKFAKRPFCHYCEQALTLAKASKDHRTPLCRGGKDDMENIVPACLTCNQRKAWRTEEEFRAVLPFLSTNWKSGHARGKTPVGSSLEERVNESNLLQTVVRERERVSWAWRHPA